MVVSFIHGYTINPCSKAAALTECIYATKNLQKDFLHNIARIRFVPEESVDQTINRLLIPVNELFVCAFNARP